jgi:hypothetical protein
MLCVAAGTTSSGRSGGCEWLGGRTNLSQFNATLQLTINVPLLPNRLIAEYSGKLAELASGYSPLPPQASF